MEVKRILIASVGGQGGLTLARVIAEVAVLSGLSVRTGETLGMAQRYGSVVSYVQIGSRVYTPKFLPGEADYLIGLELVETLRNIHYLSSRGVAIVADEYRPPYTMSFENPKATRNDLITRLKSILPSAMIIPARKIAVEAGNPRALNIVLLGAFNSIAGLFDQNVVYEAIKRVLPRKAVDTSIKAYDMGYAVAESLKHSIPI